MCKYDSDCTLTSCAAGFRRDCHEIHNVKECTCLPTGKRALSSTGSALDEVSLVVRKPVFGVNDQVFIYFIYLLTNFCQHIYIYRYIYICDRDWA